jgi:hypothetical protein
MKLGAARAKARVAWHLLDVALAPEDATQKLPGRQHSRERHESAASREEAYIVANGDLLPARVAVDFHRPPRPHAGELPAMTAPAGHPTRRAPARSPRRRPCDDHDRSQTY